MTGYDFSKLRVLVCDDSRQIRSLLVSFLNGFGIAELESFADPETAYEEFKIYDPDLVITDWNMEPISGIRFVELIRTDIDSPNPYVPIIMLTGYTELERVEQARDCGISMFLAKPLSAKDLYRRLMALADDQRGFVRNADFFGPDRRSGRRDAYGGRERRHAS